MTTRIHVVNLGPDAVEVAKVNMTPYGLTVYCDTPKSLYPGDSFNEYVHDSQSVLVTEKKP